jgi:G:T-mismatch repair DNA endonuclease (very short patch repair protein)
MENYLCPSCPYHTPHLRSFSWHVRVAHSLNREQTARTVLEAVVGIEPLKVILGQYAAGEIGVDTLCKDNRLPKDACLTLLKSLGIWRNSSEERKTPGYIRRYAEGCRASLGVDNPSKLKSIQDKKMITFQKNYGVTCQMLRPDIAPKARQACAAKAKDTWEKSKVTLKERYGILNPGCLPEVRLAHSKRMKAIFKGMDDVQRTEFTLTARKALHAGTNWTSKVERRVVDALMPIYPDMGRNVFIGSYNYDIQIGRLLIEVNGDYWHANPAKGYLATDIGANGWTCERLWRKDRNKQEQAVSLGYKVLVLWELDLSTRSDDSIIQEVQTALQRKGKKVWALPK